MAESRSSSMRFLWVVWFLLVGGIVGYAGGYLQYGTDGNGDALDATPLPVTAVPTRTPPPTEMPPVAETCPTPVAAVPAVCEEIPSLETAEDYLARGITLWNQGFYAAPLADVNTAIDLDPTLAEAYFYRGWMVHEGYQDERFRWHIDRDSALIDYSHAIKLDPDLARAYNNRGMVYLRWGEHDTALEDFQRAVELEPDYNFANLNLIAVASYLELYEDVVTYCQAYWETLTDDARYFPRERACVDAGYVAGEYEFVIETVTRQMAQNSDEPHQWLFDDLQTRGRAYLAWGRYDEALADLMRAVEVGEQIDLHQIQLTRAYLAVIDVYIAQEDNALAFTELDALITEYPTEPAPVVARADLHFQQASYEQALADYTLATQLPYYPREHVTDRIAEIAAILAGGATETDSD